MTDNQQKEFSVSRSRGGFFLFFYLLAFIIAIISPWIIIGIAEHMRYGPNPEHLWPWVTLSTLPHLAALIVLLRLSESRRFVTVRAALSRGVEHSGVFAAALFVALGVLVIAFLDVVYYLELHWLQPISPMQGDMLPLIKMSLGSFWADHRYPYHFYEVAHWEIPLTYFPGVWLPFTIPWSLGADIRALGTASFAAMMLLLAGYFIRRVSAASDWLQVLEAVPLLLVGIFIFHIPAYRGFLPALHLMPFWLFLVGWGILFIERRWIASGIFLGLCVVSRPYLAAVAPFFFAWCVWNWQSERRGVLAHCLGAALPCVLLGAPFFLLNPEAFLYGVLEWYDLASQYMLTNERWRTHGFGLSGLLWELSGAKTAGLFTHKMKIAWALNFVLLAVCWNRLKTNAQLLRAGAASMFVMLYFAVIPFFYAFTCPLILLAIAQSATESQRPEKPIAARVWLHWMRWGWVTASLLISALVFYSSLYGKPWPNEVFGTQGKRPLLEQIQFASGFEYAGWAMNDRTDRHQLLETNGYVAVPVTDQATRTFEVFYEVENPRPNAVLLANVNAEYSGALLLDAQPTEPVLLTTPRTSVFRGVNMIRIAAIIENRPGTPEEIEQMGIYIWRIAPIAPPSLKHRIE